MLSFTPCIKSMKEVSPSYLMTWKHLSTITQLQPK
jgi:hypothetical protein